MDSKQCQPHIADTYQEPQNPLESGVGTKRISEEGKGGDYGIGGNGKRDGGGG